MEHTITNIAAKIPMDIDFTGMMKFILILAGGVLLLAVLGYLLFGKRSWINHAFSSAMGILFIYAVTVIIYSFNPAGLSRFLSPLPFVSFRTDSLYIFSFQGTAFSVICGELVSMMVLAFLVNLLDTLMPQGDGVFSWYFCRFLTVIMAMVLHYVVCWLFETYLPNVLVTYAPMILLGVLVAALLLGLFKILLGLVLTISNPILGAIYTFFFSSLIGKQLTKSIFTTGVLCGVVFLLSRLGYSVICISAAALGAYIPLIVVLLIMWYLIGHVF